MSGTSPRLRVIRFLAALLLLAATLFAAGCGSGDDSPAASHGTFFGIAPDGEINETDYARMSTGGVGTVRVAFAWNAVENDHGHPYDWSAYDRVFLQIAKHGMKPLATVFGTPPEYADDPRTAPTEDAKTLDAWLDFLGAAAQRYGTSGQFWDYVKKEFPGIDPAPLQVWEIWNEPNSSTFWRPEPDPDAYAELLVKSAERIREQDGAARIMSAGMFASPQSDGAIESYDFLTQLFKRDEVGEAVDIVGLHPYGPDTEAVIEQVEQTRATIDDAGLEAEMWATEIGWGSDPEMKADLATTPERQAELLSETFGRLYEDRATWDLAGAIWYTWHDPPEAIGECGWCRSAGLLESDRDGKPSWTAYTKLTGGEE